MNIQTLLEQLSIHPTRMDELGPIIDDLADMLADPNDETVRQSFHYSASEFIAFEGVPR